MPIRAVPASPMIVRTSAKSTLMSPGLTVGQNERKERKKRELRIHTKIENLHETKIFLMLSLNGFFEIIFLIL